MSDDADAVESDADPAESDGGGRTATDGDHADADGDIAIREPPRVLIPLAVLGGETLPEPLVEFLATAEVVLLGYHQLPEQTPTEQASMQFEERAHDAVETIAAAFRDAGRTVETRVVFTHDRDQTIERIAEEVGATAVLLPNPVGDIEELLVPVRGAIDVDRLADLVATLIGEDAVAGGHVTLWGLPAAADETFDSEAAVEHAAATLRERGLAADRIATETDVAESPVRAIVERSADFDVVVMGEGADSLVGAILGDPEERVAEGAVAPVLVVRRHRQAEPAEDAGDESAGEAGETGEEAADEE